VLHVLAESFPKCGTLGVLHTVLLANSCDVRLQLSQVAVVDTREQVVLNLQIKSACEEINEVIVGSDIM